MTRAEHLRWAKDRALEYVDAGDLQNAFNSFTSDLGKHDELRGALDLQALVGFPMLWHGHLDSAEEMRKWIEGFN